MRQGQQVLDLQGQVDHQGHQGRPELGQQVQLELVVRPDLVDLQDLFILGKVLGLPQLLML